MPFAFQGLEKKIFFKNKRDFVRRNREGILTGNELQEYYSSRSWLFLKLQTKTGGTLKKGNCTK